MITWIIHTLVALAGFGLWVYFRWRMNTLAKKAELATLEAVAQKSLAQTRAVKIKILEAQRSARWEKDKEREKQIAEHIRSTGDGAAAQSELDFTVVHPSDASPGRS